MSTGEQAKASGRWWRGRNLMDPWRDAFVVQLRLRDVPGAAIGDALAQVDAHCAESGQSPLLAFGDPADYADALVPSLPRGPRVSWWASGLLAGGTMLAVVAFLSGVGGLSDRSVATLDAGDVAAAGVVAALVAAWVAWMPWLMRGGRSWPTVLGLWVGLTVPVVLGIGWQHPVVTVNAVAMLVASLLALGSAAVTVRVWAHARGRSTSPGRGPFDPVIDPRTGREPFVLPRGLGLLVSLWPWLLLAILAIATLAVILVPAP